MGQIASAVTSGMKKTMDENFKRQMDFQVENFQIQLERQLVLQNEIRERQISMQIARSREIVSKYYGPFYSIVLGGGLLGFMKKKNPAFIIPAIPLGFVLAFQYDMAYGTLMQRSRAEAEIIMKEERERIALPHGLPTFDDIEGNRLAAKQNK